jgi:hypothetical protein
VTTKVLGKLSSGNSKELVLQGDEIEFPSLEIITKLNMLATAKLSELKSRGTLAEQAAIEKLIGNLSTGSIS